MSENIKKYLKSYKFWLSACSALFLILESVLKHFNIDLNEEEFMFYVNIILGFLVFWGILSYPKSDNEQDDLEQKNQKDNNNSANNTK